MHTVLSLISITFLIKQFFIFISATKLIVNFCQLLEIVTKNYEYYESLTNHQP